MCQFRVLATPFIHFLRAALPNSNQVNQLNSILKPVYVSYDTCAVFTGCEHFLTTSFIVFCQSINLYHFLFWDGLVKYVAITDKPFFLILSLSCTRSSLLTKDFNSYSIDTGIRVKTNIQKYRYYKIRYRQYKNYFFI